MARFQSDAAVSADRGHLLTEQPKPRSTALDLLDTAELVGLFVDASSRGNTEGPSVVRNYWA